MIFIPIKVRTRVTWPSCFVQGASFENFTSWRFVCSRCGVSSFPFLFLYLYLFVKFFYTWFILLTYSYCSLYNLSLSWPTGASWVFAVCLWYFRVSPKDADGFQFYSQKLNSFKYSKNILNLIIQNIGLQIFVKSHTDSYNHNVLFHLKVFVGHSHS